MSISKLKKIPAARPSVIIKIEDGSIDKISFDIQTPDNKIKMELEQLVSKGKVTEIKFDC